MPGSFPIDVPDSVWTHPDMPAALTAGSVGAIGPLLKLVKQYTGASQSQLANALDTTQGRISKYLNDLIRVERMDMFQRVADGLGMPDEARMVFGLAPRSTPLRPAPVVPSEVISTSSVSVSPLSADLMKPSAGVTDLRQVEILRQELHDALSEGTVAEASLDDWDRLVTRYGRATRDRPANVLLDDLTADLTELKRTIQRYRSASAMRRLTRVAAQMSGLMCLTLCKLDDRPGFRRWTRTARIAANEAGDPVVHSWILAQEAYGHYYSGDMIEAVDVAKHAQELVPTSPCVGAGLAAALEARAHAAMGNREGTRAALARAEEITAQLDGDDLIPSAFGYNEAQLRFHAGSALTHLQDVKAALAEQERALELCMPGDYTDWAMTRLDRAACLLHSDGTTDALTYATETVDSLTQAQRKGIITLRGHEILNSLPKQRQALPAAQGFRELLNLSADTMGIEG
jgi:transcriptional regulator with XRE-family HTH domain/tetratricopeptide (TPR) repeat protein